jgi:hypothetical protein
MKSETARANGAKSNGPVTPEGKARSARNSLKHGLSGHVVVLEHESQEEYNELEVSLILRFQPADSIERELVHEMAAARWRLKRIEEMEAAVLRKAIRTQMEILGPEADIAEARSLAYAEVAESKSLRMLTRYQSQIRRGYEKAWQELDRLQAEWQNAEEQNDNEQNEPNFQLTEEQCLPRGAGPRPAAASQAAIHRRDPQWKE